MACNTRVVLLQIILSSEEVSIIFSTLYREELLEDRQEKLLDTH